MDERLRFVARLLDGEGHDDALHEFGISRKTAYKISGTSLSRRIRGVQGCACISVDTMQLVPVA